MGRGGDVLLEAWKVVRMPCRYLRRVSWVCGCGVEKGLCFFSHPAPRGLLTFPEAL